jgi:hypothetical protein
MQKRLAMKGHRARILIVDHPNGRLSQALAPGLARHDVELARDAFDAIAKIDSAIPPHDLIFCDLSLADLAVPELWDYLSLASESAARRMVFVASGPLDAEARRFLARVPKGCIELGVLAPDHSEPAPAPASAGESNPCAAH